MTEATTEDEEITLSEIGRKIRRAFYYLFSKWYILLAVGIIGAAVGLAIAVYSKPTYTAKLNFVLSTESKTSSFSGLATQFGIDLGGSSGNDVFSGDNILTLFKSAKMLKPVLFKKPPGSNESLANIIVKEWEWDKKWLKGERTAHAFPFPDEITKVRPVQDSLLREVQDRLVDKYLSVARLDKKLSVYNINTTSTSEIFSCYLTLYLMDETATFYIETKTSVSKKNLAMLQSEADSLRFLLGRNITATAASIDKTFNLNSALQVQRSPTQKSQANSTVVATAYAEVVKNLEIAKITLQKETPLYQIIDTPVMPLKATRISKTVAMISGFFVAALTCAALLFLMKKKVNHS